MARYSKERIKEVNEYRDKTYKRLTLYIRKDNKEVIEKLESVESTNGYITELIKADIKKEKRKASKR